MPELTVGQYSLVFNMFSFTIATMFAAFIFFVLGRGQVAPKYRGALMLSAIVVAVAGYHYFRISQSWEDAYRLQPAAVESVEDAGAAAAGEAMYVPTGAAFNDAYRYVDWLLTVPLLVAELIAVLALPKNQSLGLMFRLGLAAALMIILGYPGEIATDNTTRAIWGFLSTLPFVYLLFALFTQLGDAMERQPKEARVLIRNARLLLLATWGFYPIVYMLPFIGGLTATVVVAIQVGYAIADVLAKAGYGLLIYGIARAKTDALESEQTQGMGAPAMATGD